MSCKTEIGNFFADVIIAKGSSENTAPDCHGNSIKFKTPFSFVRSGKLVPVGYGIKKLQINCVIEDDKVSAHIAVDENEIIIS